MGEGLKGQWGVGDPKAAGSDKQSKDFQATFQKELGAINEHLQFTATHAEAAKHDPLAGKRDALTPAFQSALGQIDPANAAKAKGAIDKVLADARALSGEVATFRKDVQKAHDDWQKARPKLDAAVTQIEELEGWEDKEAKNLRAASDAIVKQENDRQYAEAGKALGELEGKVKPVHEEYVKQKEAKEKYELAFDAVEPKLADCETSEFKKLEAKQQDITKTKEEMEKSVEDKNFVAALQSVGTLESLVADYETALAEIEKHKEAYEASLAELGALNVTTPTQKFKKLETMETDIATQRQTMETAATDEDFELADQSAQGLITKIPALETAQAEIEKAKADYEAALVPLEPRLEAAAKCEEGALMDLREEVHKVQAQMEQAATDEDFVQALALTGTLATFLDSLESAEANEIYIVEFKGQKHCGTMAEIAALKAAITLAGLKQVVGPLKNKATSNAGYYNDLQSLADTQYVISAVLHTIGGTSLGPVSSAVSAQNTAIDSLSGAISGDPAGAQGAYEAAVNAVNAAGKAITAYMDALEAGANNTITALQVVEVVCFAVAAACGAALLAPAGATLAATMAANGIAGAGFGALQTVAEEALAPAAFGDANKINPGEVVSKAALNAVLSGAGGALGGAGGKGSAVVVESVMVKLGCKEVVVRVAVKEFVEGGIGNAIQTVVAGAPGLVTGKTTWAQFWEAVATNFIAGGIAGRVAGKLGAKQAFDKPITGADLDAWAKGFDQGVTP